MSCKSTLVDLWFGCVVLAAMGFVSSSSAAGRTPAVVTGNARVDGLLSRMSLDEKLTLLRDGPEDPLQYQGQAGYVGGIPRLGIPGLRMADGPPGVLTRHPSQAESATMAVAATFDVALARENGTVIGREARALGIDVALQPFINIDRDLSFRRAYNTFGEDPLLTSRMGAAVIQGIQSQHVMAMAKHFIGFDTAAGDVWIDEQSLHEVYAAPFEAAVEAGVASVMCSYNHINGPYACGNSALLTGLLRTQWMFKGFITSDWGATHSAQFMTAGLDLEMIDGPDSSGYQEPAFFGARAAATLPSSAEPQETKGDIYGGTVPEEPRMPMAADGDFGEKVTAQTIQEALENGTVQESRVTRAAGRVLVQMDRFGFLDGASKHRITRQSIASNSRVIRHTGQESAVLLKNETAILPLRVSDLSSTVLIGPTAQQVDAIGINGERSMGLPSRQVGPLDALRKLGGAPDLPVAVDDDMTGTPIPAGALSHDGMPGLLRRTAGSSRSDDQINFTLSNGHSLPVNMAAQWAGELTIPTSGSYWVYLQALGTNARVSIDGSLIGITGTFQGDVHGDILQANQDNVVPTTDGLDNVRHAVQLSAGRHSITVDITPDTSNAPVQLRLNWYTPSQRRADHEAAIEAARHAKVAIVFLWARREPAFVIPGEQNKLVEDVCAVNANTIVVLNTSQPVELPWIDCARAILEMWWPGDEGGWATAEVLLGRANPAGRLPVTWAAHLKDYPATDPRYPERSAMGIGHRTTYSEGVNVGYRWFDHENINPLYPFGHGLSYSQFMYSSLKLAPAADGGVDLSVDLQNIRGPQGDEVPQVYLEAPRVIPPGIQFPLRSLIGFARVHLNQGQKKRVTLHVAPRQLQYWSTNTGGWVFDPRPWIIHVGSSSRDLRLQGMID